MYYIKHNIFCSKFADNLLLEIDLFLKECELPEFEFMDADFEGLKCELKINFEKLEHIVHQNTFSIVSSNKHSIPYEWEQTQPERYKNAIIEITEISLKLYETYTSFIKIARRKIYVE
jgi:hypothetical protein